MATTPPTNEAFMREVDEELRRSQMRTMFRRYGIAIVLAVLLGLAAFGAYLWWQHDQVRKAGVEGEALTAAIEELGTGKRDAAKVKLDKLAASDHPGYRATARLTLADVALEKGDTRSAVAAFEAVHGDKGIAAPFRDLALVRQTAVEFDALPPATVVARLKPLAISGSPWFGSAGEMVAMAYLKLGKRDLAGSLFQAIAKDEKVPGTIRSRAIQMAGILGFDAVPQNMAAPAAGGAGRE